MSDLAKFSYKYQVLLEKLREEFGAANISTAVGNGGKAFSVLLHRGNIARTYEIENVGTQAVDQVKWFEFIKTDMTREHRAFQPKNL